MEKNINKLKKYRWAVWGILSLAYIIVFFHRLAVGVVRDDLVGCFNISSTTFANLGATYFYAYMLMQIPSGILADTLGARLTVTIGTMLAGAGSILFGLAPNITSAFIGRLVVGIGVSVVFISILKVQSEWFYEREFGTMSGLTSFVGNIGGLLAQTPLVMLVAAFTWRKTFVAIGLISLAVSLLCYMIVRNRPTDIGLPSIAELEGRKIKNNKINIKNALLEVISNLKTWPAFFVFAGFFGAYVSITGTWGVSFLKDVYGMSKITAGNYMMIAVLGLSIGSIAIGKISDKMGRRKLPMIIFGSVYLLSWFVLVFVNGGRPPVKILGILFFVMGFSCSTFVLGWACGKEINNPKYSGISTSVVNIGGFVGAALIPLLIGKFMDKYANVLNSTNLYHRAFLFSLVAALIGFIFILLVKETECRNIYSNNEGN
ncbi:putative sulfoacetate transporter SauU [Clostridium tepidiprofundi DSM 19306]|uniref:Putative sulfoacetate transporter SauU n=1 Tax=Clostridium tepidiprofundi DSM 19306 TaxID=1121338 RepID=A0A151B7W1_9CLOT|nr:MFS transporter [Clostridium tepidiprofundi]KYH35979.1 putative sulfoacetate transporter SauU [Clostridium tepidiprofundi DSM 19306]